MISQQLRKRLAKIEARLIPMEPLPIVFVGGWDHDDPRHQEYMDYLDQSTDLENDPAFIDLEWDGDRKAYDFDHTKVPKRD